MFFGKLGPPSNVRSHYFPFFHKRNATRGEVRKAGEKIEGKYVIISPHFQWHHYTRLPLHYKSKRQMLICTL